MPTGYTYPVQDGKITELRDFALLCTRGFGALIMMRDEPMDAPIPETLGANTQYHDEALARGKASRVEVNMLSASEREQRAAARAEKGRCWNRPGRLALHPKPDEGSSLLT